MIMPLIRCMHYDDDGRQINKGCLNKSFCDFVHPSEDRWDRAARKAMARSKGDKDRAGGGHGPPRPPRQGFVPKGPRALSSIDKTDSDAFSTGTSNKFQGSSSNAWNASKSTAVDWSAPLTSSWGDASASANDWTSAPTGWGAPSNEESSSSWTNAPSGWETRNDEPLGSWGGQAADSNDKPWGDPPSTANKTEDDTLAAAKDTDLKSETAGTTARAGWGTAQGWQTDVEMGNAEASTGGWGSSNSMGPPPPPPTALPPTPPVSSGFKEPLRINPPERRSPAPEPTFRNVFSERAIGTIETSTNINPLKRKFDGPTTPVSPCTTIASASVNVPRPHTEAAINAVRERMQVEDAASADSRSPSLVPSQGSSNDVWGSKNGKDAKLISKLTRAEKKSVWHNHIKLTQRAMNARRKLEEAEANLMQCENMVRSDRFRQVGSTGRDVLEGHRSACALEVEHKRKSYEEVLAVLVKDDERFDIPPLELFRSGEEATQKKEFAEIKRYLESAKSWMETTHGEIETLRDARERAQKEEAAAAASSKIPVTEPGPSVQRNEISTDNSSKAGRKISAKVLKRLDELEDQLANVETDLESLTSSIEEKIRDQVQASLEDQDILFNASDDEMDEDGADRKGQTDARSPDDLAKEAEDMREDISILKQYAADAQSVANVNNGILEECKDMAGQLQAKEGELYNDLVSVKSEREELLRVLEEARQQKSEMEFVVEEAARRHEEAANITNTAALVETLMAPIISSVKQAILPEVEEVGKAVVKDAEKKVNDLNEQVVKTVWEKVELPLRTAKRMAQNLSQTSLKSRARAPSLSTATRAVPPFSHLVPSGTGNQPQNGASVQ